jgi:hypothetical protein
MLKERLDKGVLKYSKGLYRNLWFLVKKKKPGEYKLINLTIVIRRDANLPLSINEFMDEFIGYYIISLVNLYSSYN